MKRVEDKINEIRGFLDELKEIPPIDFKEYKSSLEKRAACERYVEKIVEAIVDLAFLTIKLKKMKIPDDDTDAFNILLDNKVISDELAKALKNAKGMRNIIAHEYGKIDDEIVFDSVSNELESDAKKFIDIIEKYFGVDKKKSSNLDKDS